MPPPILTPRAWITLLLALGVFILASHALDTWAYAASAAYTKSLPKPVAMYDWYQLLRQLGSILTWAIIALAWWLASIGVRARHDLPRPERLPVAILLAVAVAGAIAEGIKPLIGRMRPEDTDGTYQFMEWSKRASEWSDLGIPSSHAAVAFASAMVITRWRPLAGLALIPLACGTCFTRIVNANHFLSDTAAGAAIGIVAGLLACKWCKVGRE